MADNKFGKDKLNLLELKNTKKTQNICSEKYSLCDHGQLNF